MQHPSQAHIKEIMLTRKESHGCNIHAKLTSGKQEVQQLVQLLAHVLVSCQWPIGCLQSTLQQAWAELSFKCGCTEQHATGHGSRCCQSCASGVAALCSKPLYGSAMIASASSFSLTFLPGCPRQKDVQLVTKITSWDSKTVCAASHKDHLLEFQDSLCSLSQKSPPGIPRQSV